MNNVRNLKFQYLKTVLRVQKMLPEAKAELWMNIDNPMFGGIKPLEMLLMGRYIKLTQFIKDAKELYYERD